MTSEQHRRRLTHPRSNAAAPPLFGLSVRVHRFVLIVLAIAGFFGGVVLGQRMFGVWGEFLGAIIGTLVVEAFVWRLIPAICPDCGRRADCVLSGSRPQDFHLQPELENRSAGTVIRYHCRSCGFQLPQPVVTPDQLAAAGMSAIRVARFAQGFFTLIGGTMTIIAAGASAHGLAHRDLSTAGIGAACMAFAIAFTIVARRAVGGFAEAVRQGTQPSDSHSSNTTSPLKPDPTGRTIMNTGQRPEPSCILLEGFVDGIRYRAESLSFGNVELWIELPQHQMQLPPQFFETRTDLLNQNDAQWGGEQIQALFDLGAKDVDVGFHTDHIQVVFPQDQITVTRPLAERAVALMIALRREAVGEAV
jgi:hypothetical protein